MKFTTVNTNLYKTFIAVFEERNLSRAADRVNKTQPTITHEIKTLESQLGVKLFHSHPRGVDPTNHASEVYARVTKAFSELLDVEVNFRVFNHDSHATVKIAFDSHFAMLFSINHVVEFGKLYPNVKFSLDVGNLSDSDLLIRFSSGFAPTESNVKIISMDKVKQVYIANAEFAAKHNIKDNVTSKELETFLLSNKIDISQPEVAVHFVNNGVGVGLFIENYIDRVHSDKEFVKFRVEEVDAPTLRYEFVYRENTTKVTEEFIRFVRDRHKNNIWSWRL